MGLVGERYGWVPEADHYDPSLLQEQPWIEEHRGGRSVTELEVLHGVLNNPAMTGRAFFYFRAPAYSASKGGAYLSEGADDQQKLAALKDSIRQSGFPVVESYPTPEALADKVRDDLWNLIEESFPAEETPDPLAIERGRHEGYSASRLGLYLGGETYFHALDAALAENEAFKPVLITGASGGGKSALVANWCAVYTKNHPATLLILHHLGAGADAADPVKLVTRLMQEIARITGDELKLEADPQKLLDLLPDWLARASAYATRHDQEWLLILDGLDKLSSLRDLRWWPAILPPRVKLVASCLKGEVLESMHKRMDWMNLEVHPLSRTEQQTFITDFLGRYRKSLTPAQVERVLTHALSGNPLFMLTLLEELRVFGVHEELEHRLSFYLTSETVDDLFERVLERVEGDTSPSSVRSAMEAIWASRAGLAQDELLALTGLVPATWAPIHNALDEAILESGGRLNFGHDYFRKAVEDRYLPTPKRQEAHLRLAKWFDQQKVTSRVAEELPWQWQQADEKEKLKECLTCREIFTLILAQSQIELLSYWLIMGTKIDLSLIYSIALESWSDDSNLAIPTANFLVFAGFADARVKIIYQKSIGNDSELVAGDYRSYLLKKRDYAEFLRIRSEYDECERVLREVCSAADQHFGIGDVDCRAMYATLATVLWNTCRLNESEALLLRLIKIGHSSINLCDDELKSAMQLALVWHAQGKYSAATSMLKRVIANAERLVGVNAMITQDAWFYMAKSLCLSGSSDEAQMILMDVLHWQEEFLGVNHPHRERTRFWIATIMASNGDCGSAERILREDLESAIKRDGIYHHETRAGQSGLARILIQKGLCQEAETLLRECVEVGELILECGPVTQHADVMGDRIQLANACLDNGKIEEAENLASLASFYFFNLGGQHHSDWVEASKILMEIGVDKSK
jgi:hypothetical protein